MRKTEDILRRQNNLEKHMIKKYEKKLWMRMLARHCKISEATVRCYCYGGNSTMKILEAMDNELEVEVKDLM